MAETIVFEIGGTELEKAKKFIKTHKCRLPPKNSFIVIKGKLVRHKDAGPISNYYIASIQSYRFARTSIGTTVWVKCVCGKEKNVTDYDSW